MKRITALFIALAMLLSLAACGVSSSGHDDTDGFLSDTSDSQNEAADGNDANPGEFEFTEVTVVDNSECAIKITGIDSNDFSGFTVTAQLENKSSDKTYKFSVDSASVNGVVCDASLSARVAPGEKVFEKVSFSDDTLEEIGIGRFTDIELSFIVYDSEDLAEDNVAEETVSIYPYGEDKAVKYVREAQPGDEVIVDNEYATVIATGYNEDGFWGYEAYFYVVNKSENELTFTADDVSVNGFVCDPYYIVTVPAGKCAFSTMDWYESDFEDLGITEVESIEFELNVHDDSLSDHYVNMTVTLNP